MAGSWGWFALLAAMLVFNTVLGEELLFRGFLLPRMNGVFGRRDWLANGVLFAVYHLHEPWVIPAGLWTPSSSPIPPSATAVHSSVSQCTAHRASSSYCWCSPWCSKASHAGIASPVLPSELGGRASNGPPKSAAHCRSSHNSRTRGSRLAAKAVSIAPGASAPS